MPQASTQALVFDMRAIRGPVYAKYTNDVVSFFECQCEAQRHGFQDWPVYAQARKLESGDTFLATLGGVVQFQPAGVVAAWRDTLPSRFDRTNRRNPEPELPPPGIDCGAARGPEHAL